MSEPTREDLQREIAALREEQRRLGDLLKDWERAAKEIVSVLGCTWPLGRDFEDVVIEEIQKRNQRIKDQEPTK